MDELGVEPPRCRRIPNKACSSSAVNCMLTAVNKRKGREWNMGYGVWGNRGMGYGVWGRGNWGKE